MNLNSFIRTELEKKFKEGRLGKEHLSTMESMKVAYNTKNKVQVSVSEVSCCVHDLIRHGGYPFDCLIIKGGVYFPANQIDLIRNIKRIKSQSRKLLKEVDRLNSINPYKYLKHEKVD